MRELVRNGVRAVQRWHRFVTHDIWHIGQPGEQVPDGFLIQQIRVVVLVGQSLIEGTLLLRAAALTFATMLAAVPFLVLMFFVFQALKLDEQMPKFMATQMAFVAGWDADADEGQQSKQDLEEMFVSWLTQGVGQPRNGLDGGQKNGTAPGGDEEPAVPEDAVNPVQSVVDMAKESANAETIGIGGMIFVLVTVLGLIRNIDSSFNAIWGLGRTRSWLRIFSDYLLIIILLPIVVAAVLSAAAILQADNVGRWEVALRGGQYVLIWFAFAALYYLIPNTKVRMRYALLAGVVAGTMWVLLSAAYAQSQIGLARYSLIYGTLAFLPLLLMWVYFSWMIMLFGAELTFAYQNEKTFAMERLAAGASYAYKEAVGLRAMAELAHRFDQGSPPLTAGGAAQDWGVPTRLLNDAFETLEHAGLVQRTASDPPGYLPARSPGKIRLNDVINALREHGRDPSPLRESPALEPVVEVTDQFGWNGPAGKPLQTLADELHSNGTPLLSGPEPGEETQPEPREH